MPSIYSKLKFSKKHTHTMTNYFFGLLKMWNQYENTFAQKNLQSVVCSNYLRKDTGSSFFNLWSNVVNVHNLVDIENIEQWIEKKYKKTFWSYNHLEHFILITKQHNIHQLFQGFLHIFAHATFFLPICTNSSILKY